MKPHPPDIDPPPILGTWPRLYLGVGLFLLFLIAVFSVFTRVFTP
jgi:hypothetical protein